MNSKANKPLLLCLAGYALLLFLIVYGYIDGRLSVRMAGVDFILLASVAVVIVTILLARLRKETVPFRDDPVSSPDSLEGRALRKTIRNYKIAIVVMFVILIDGIWDSKGFPLWVTLVGASINIGINGVLVRIVRTKTAELSRRSRPQGVS